jgi:hypothetical protein
MNDPKSRAERREEQRATRKDFEHIVKDIKQGLEQRPNDEFKMAIVHALQALEMSPHDNNRIAALMVGGCVEAASRGDDNAARLLLYVSGAVVDPILTRFLLNLIIQARQAYVPETPKPPHTGD